MLLPSLCSPGEAQQRLDQAPGRLLAVVEYGEQRRVKTQALHIRVPLRASGGEPPIELWPASGAVSRQAGNGVEISHDGTLLFGVMALRGVARGGNFEERIGASYAAMTDACRALGYPHPLRMWNFIPGIHESHAGLDRYQSFCRARHEPLERHLKAIGDGFPAATVIGTRAQEGVIYFLAAKEPGRHLENPRQLPPPEYPEAYGPRSPSFSRATLARSGGETANAPSLARGPRLDPIAESALYISGTASIVGHESRHSFDTGRQTREILRNLEELVQTAGRASGLAFRDLRDIVRARVFLRDLADLPAVSALLQPALPGAQPILYHEGDLCRRELMIEIEGIAVPGAPR